MNRTRRSEGGALLSIYGFHFSCGRERECKFVFKKVGLTQDGGLQIDKYGSPGNALILTLLAL